MKSGHGEIGLRSFTNITYDELEVGSTATVSRRISQTEVDALALVSGDVDAFHLASNGSGVTPGTTAKAVGATPLPFDARWNASTSPLTSASASTSVWLIRRDTVAVEPTSSSS